MISLTNAQALSRTSARWSPQAGDRFTVRTEEMTGEVFTVADMVVEARDYPNGTLLAFNGTTEWALDSVQLEQALWLPTSREQKYVAKQAIDTFVVRAGDFVAGILVAGGAFLIPRLAGGHIDDPASTKIYTITNVILALMERMRNAVDASNSSEVRHA